MVRNIKKKALYEVIIGAGPKSSYGQLHPKGVEQAPAGPITPTQPNEGKGGGTGVSSVVRWIRKPRFVQFNAGRVEFSVPYQLGIAILLGMVLVVVVAFRLGERFGRGESPAAVKQITPATPAAKAVKAPSTSSGQAGRNRIVIQMYQVRSHLEPVKEYFDKLGVATEIIEKDKWFYLVTKNKYESVDKSGTDGYLARQKIIELGAGYKAPAGSETFGPKPFSGAFGMKFEE
jgi:hypothetical protein